MKTKIIRVHEELAKEIDRIKKKDEVKFVEASRELAKALREKRTSKKMGELF